MMSHLKANRVVYVHGELDARLMEEIENHLRNCPSCQEEVACVRQVARFVENLPRSSAPDELLYRVEEEIARGSIHSGKSFWPGLWEGLFREHRYAAIAAIVILFAVSSYVLVHWRMIVPEAPESSAVLDLAPYLDGIERSAEINSLQKLSIVPAGFHDIDRDGALNAALLEGVTKDFPGNGFAMIAQRMIEINRVQAIELVFQKHERIVSVFIGSGRMKFIAGGRKTQSERIGPVKGGKYAKDQLVAFFWGSPKMHCGFITTPGGEGDLPMLLASFKQAYEPN